MEGFWELVKDERRPQAVWGLYYGGESHGSPELLGMTDKNKDKSNNKILFYLFFFELRYN